MSKWAMALASVLVLILTLTTMGCSQSNTVEGVVDHKVLSGVKDSTQYMIVFNAPDDDGTPVNDVGDDTFQGLFPLHGELVVTEDLENQMGAVYSDFVYQVSVDKSPDDTFGYLTTRETFNRMSLGATVKFQVSDSSGIPRIVKIID
jgi:hypothetical protein